MKRRKPPDSSQTLFRIPGNLFSRRSMTSLTVPASTSTTSAPPVCLRRGVGITTLSDMSGSLFHGPLESLDLRFDDIGCVHRDGFGGFQPVAGDRNHRDTAPVDVAL